MDAKCKSTVVAGALAIVARALLEDRERLLTDPNTELRIEKRK